MYEYIIIFFWIPSIFCFHRPSQTFGRILIKSMKEVARQNKTAPLHGYFSTWLNDTRIFRTEYCWKTSIIILMKIHWSRCKQMPCSYQKTYEFTRRNHLPSMHKNDHVPLSLLLSRRLYQVNNSVNRKWEILGDSQELELKVIKFIIHGHIEWCLYRDRINRYIKFN